MSANDRLDILERIARVSRAADEFDADALSRVARRPWFSLRFARFAANAG